MTEGAKFAVTHEEMKKHLAERAEHHQSRWTFYKAEVKRHEEAMAQYTDLADELSKATHSNIRGLADQAKRGVSQHSQDYFKFKFLSEHLTGNDYLLDYSELRELSFIKEGAWAA